MEMQEENLHCVHLQMIITLWGYPVLTDISSQADFPYLPHKLSEKIGAQRGGVSSRREGNFQASNVTLLEIAGTQPTKTAASKSLYLWR